MYDKKGWYRVQVGAGAVDNVSASGVHSYSYVVTKNVRVTRLLALTTAAFSGFTTDKVQVTYRRRPAYGSSVGQSTMGVVTIPSTAVANKLYYLDITPVNLDAGDSVVFDITSAAGGGTAAAGQLLFDVEVDYDPETAANVSDMVASS